MKVTESFSKVRSTILSHNEFLPEENEYDDDDNNNESENSQQRLEEQLFSTRLYLLLLSVALLIVIFFFIFNPQTLIKTINNPSISTYKQLYDQYSNTLSCPCSTITISYESFVSINYSMHPLCTFVNDEWILAFYFRNSSHFGPIDFRSTASAQFGIIKQLCLMAQETIANDLITSLNQSYLISSNVLTENEVMTSVNGTSETIRSNAPLLILRTLSLVRVTTKSNRLVSSLRTNYDLQFAFPVLYIPIGYANDDGIFKCGCEMETCTLKVELGFFDETNNSHQIYFRPSFLKENQRIHGFFGSCTLLDAVLMADFSCFYNETCLNLLLNYFPHLTQKMLFQASLMMSNMKEKKNLSQLVEQLFIIDWSISINHNRYYEQCSPKSCSYTYKENTNILYALTKLLSFYGGLTMALRFVVPKIITTMMRRRRRLVTDQSERNILQSFGNLIQRIKSMFIKLNLFKTTNRDQIVINQQRLTTRIYLIVLLSCLMISSILFASRKQLMIISVESPSFDSYQSLLSTTNNLSCSCSQMSTTYGQFLSFSPSFHQICNSIFIKDDWFEWIAHNMEARDVYIFDWRFVSYASFNILSKLCQLSNSTAFDAINRFEEQIFVSIHLLEENIFMDNSKSIMNEFIQSTETNFGETIDMLRMLNHVNQPMSARGINAQAWILTGNELSFLYEGPFNGYGSSNCVCILDSQCQLALGIWNTIRASNRPNRTFSVSGFVQGCYTTESLLLSNLQCLYSNNSECLSALIFYANNNFLVPVNITVEPLNSSLTTRFSQTDLISTIVYKLMVEQWSPNISYRNYFDICAPKQCNYRQIQSLRIIDIITILISLYGGLSIVLRLIMPQVMKIFLKRTSVVQINPSTEPHASWCIRICSNTIELIRMKIMDFNIFPLRSFGNIDRDNVKHLSRLSTRFYIILFAVTLTTFVLYTFVQYQIFIKTIDNPSMADYQQWLVRASAHQSTVACPCSTTSIVYRNFLQIEPSFHQICSSDFVSNEWQKIFIQNINLNLYKPQDYRRFIPIHLKLLLHLCQISINHVNNSILFLLSSHFVTTRLLSEDIFNSRLNSLMNETYMTVPTTLVRQLTLIRTMLHGNQFVSVYETNFKYLKSTNLEKSVLSESMIYNNSCSCDLQMNCSSQSIFKGLHIGCLPSEALFVSTLECFYDNECLTLMKSQLANRTNINVTINPLNSSLPSQYSWNRTIVNDLVKQLFIETWSTSINYTKYFYQCLPAQCTYTYVKQANLFYSITALISLSSGLTVILEWLCPIVIKLAWKVWRRRYNNSIAPENLEQR